MLNGDGNENGIKTNRSNKQKKKKIARVAHFFSNQQKNKFARAARFLYFFAVFYTTTTLFYRTKSYRQTSQLHIIFMEELSYVLTQYIFFCVHVRFYFSLPLISPCWPLLSHCLTAALNFHVFLPTKFVSFFFSHSLQLILCYPRQYKHKKQRRKRHGFVVVISFLKSGWHAISFQINP